MDIKEALELAAKIASGQYGQDELDRFIQFIRSAKTEQVNQILDVYKESLDQLERHSLQVNPDFIDRLRALKPQPKEDLSTTPLVKMRSGTAWFRWASVAAVLLLSVGGYFYLSNKNEKQHTIATVQAPADIQAPQSSRATITLASGQHIFLDSAANGNLVNQGNVQVVKLADGQIAYRGKGEEMVYNTLTNPRGSKPVTVTLSDGTRVLLNTESSLTYPVAFSGKERNVEITGEAYFEVAHNGSMPFTVKKLHDDAKVEVIGTHFNVNAYEDETAIKVTLLEGSVKVSKGQSSGILKPGQQAQLSSSSPMQIVKMETSGLDEVMAWKNGTFYFREADINTVMRQLARWYDFDVSYAGVVKEKFFLDINRNTHVDNIFKILEATRGVHFKIEGKKITVLP